MVKTSIFSKIVTFTLLLYPIFKSYGWKNSISYIVAMALALLFIIYQISKGKFRIKGGKMPWALAVYFFYSMFVNVITETSVVSAIPISLVMSFMMAYLFFENIEYDYLLKAYRVVALICIAFFWLQEFSFQTTGYRPPSLISFLPINTIRDSASEIAYQQMYINERSSSFFAEPAHFVQFLLPLLCLELFGTYKNYSRAVIIVLTLLYLRSGNALIGLGAIAVVFVFQLFSSKTSFSKKILILAMIAAAGYGGVKYAESDTGVKLMERQEEIDFNATSGGSGFLRVVRGYLVYGDYNVLEKVVGLRGQERIEEHTKKFAAAFSYGASDYYNGIQYVLIHTGLIGMLIFLSLLRDLWRKNNLCGKSSLLCFFALCFVSAIMMSEVMWTFLIVASLCQKQQRQISRNSMRKVVVNQSHSLVNT